MDRNIEAKLTAALKNGDFREPLKQHHRDIMLDLVLAWGSLDGALTQLVSALKGTPLHEEAERIGKANGSTKLTEIVRLLRSIDGAENAARKFRKHKKDYEKYSNARNRIAHGHCSGYLASDERYVVFLVAEHYGDGDMAIEAISIEEMILATTFGKALTILILSICGKIYTVRGDDVGSTEE